MYLIGERRGNFWDYGVFAPFARRSLERRVQKMALAFDFPPYHPRMVIGLLMLDPLTIPGHFSG